MVTEHYGSALLLGLATLAACSESATEPPAPESPDVTPPAVAIEAPGANEIVSGTVTIRATAEDDVGVVGVRFLSSSVLVGEEDTESPYEVAWYTHAWANGARSLVAEARDAEGNKGRSQPLSIVLFNTGALRIEITCRAAAGMPTA